MTTKKPSDTIAAISPTVQGAYTMKEPEEVLTMKTLHAKGYSPWQIAGILGCSHHTVSRYVKNGFEATPRQQPPSALDPHAEFLLERFLQHNGNADVVRQALATELGIEVSLRTVQRALKPYRERLKASRLVTQRFETKPGEQLQIDFGEKWTTIEGREQKVHLLVATLGYSRRLFAKAYPQETQREWFDGTERAFMHFGGVPTTDLADAKRRLDNPKALVTTPRHNDRAAVFNDRLFAFAKYWEFKPRACWPRRARTKGKVERSVGYVKHNALAGRIFARWGDLDRRLAMWIATLADHRILSDPGDTPLARFNTERKQLKALDGKPPFGTPRELPRVVNADAMIVLDTNRYAVPWELIGQQVQVAPSATTIQIYHGATLVADHPRCEGRHQRRLNKAHFQTGPTPVDSAPQDISLVRPLDAYADYVQAQTERRHER